MKRLFIALLLLSLTAFAAFADDDAGNPNDPTINENANACFEDGTMAGKCNVDFDGNGAVDQYEADWAWECGWYLIRYEYNLLPSVPARCATVVPALYSMCYSVGGTGSFAMVGRPNTSDNVVFFAFGTPDCTGEPFAGGPSVVVTGADFAEAYANCDALGNVVFLEKLRNLGYNAPADYWGCVAL